MSKKISLAELRAGAFVGAPILKTVKFLKDGEELEFDVFIRKLSYQSVINDSKAYGVNSDAFIAGRILACVYDDSGKPLFESLDQIMGLGDFVVVGALNEDLTCALYAAVAEVNDVGKLKSTVTTNSGTNLSSTGSAAKPSRKRNSRSATKSTSSGETIGTSAAV